LDKKTRLVILSDSACLRSKWEQYLLPKLRQFESHKAKFSEPIAIASRDIVLADVKTKKEAFELVGLWGKACTLILISKKSQQELGDPGAIVWESPDVHLVRLLRDIATIQKIIDEPVESVSKQSWPGVNRLQLPSEILLIGASTGGPPVVTEIISSLRPQNRAVFIIQHISQGFDEKYRANLEKVASMPVELINRSTEIEPDHIYVAPKGSQTLFCNRSGKAHAVLLSGPHHSYFTPSVDVTMLSAALNFGSQASGVILTGMGDDGARGLLALQKSGGGTIAQSKSSCAVFGMPGAAIAAGAANLVLNIDEMLLKLGEGGRCAEWKEAQ